MFSSLMPNRNEFFELLAAHSDLVVAGSNAALRLVNGLGQGSEDIPALAAEVNFNEKAADKIKAELIGLLHKSFTTPINRDQIHTLTIELDLVLNALKEVANSVNMYNITESTAEARELASLGADACLRLHRGVGGLGSKDKSRKAETLSVCSEIDILESKADAIERKAIGKLFDGSHSIWTAIKMREFYTLQENVLNRCEDAAKTIEEILIENS
jgi:uncharacterized protein